MSIQSRRVFIGTALAAGALAASCSTSEPKVAVPVLHDKAPDGPPLKAGLVGCGGRGRGAAKNFINAGQNCQVVALADVFQDRVDEARKNILEETGQEIQPDRCFVGFDACQKVLDCGIEVMLHATPPHFRPEHFAAAVKAGKHCFIEKPVAVDPVGVRSIIETAGQAKTKNLCVVSGTCYRHDKKVIETLRRVADGVIGDIVTARCYYNMGQLWYKVRKEGWSDMEAMIRDWVNWCWLSGDHIVEQHVHNLDTISLFLGVHPVKAVGFGSRQRRVTGDQYDNFAVDFTYENGMHLSSMCRQIDGCTNNVSDYLLGTKGATDCHGTIFKPDGSVLWKIDTGDEKSPAEKGKSDKEKKKLTNMYDQEHIDFVTAIRTSEPVNEIIATAESTLMGIMGRISAYTGQETTWDETMKSDKRLGPTSYEMGPVAMETVIPVPGAEKTKT